MLIIFTIFFQLKKMIINKLLNLKLRYTIDAESSEGAEARRTGRTVKENTDRKKICHKFYNKWQLQLAKTEQNKTFAVQKNF